MASTGNVFAGAGSTVDRAGAAAWTNPGNVVSDNATNATTTTTPTDYLIASSFGFSSLVPANVAIRGITVRVEMTETGTGSSNYVVQLCTDTTPTLVGNASGSITISGGPAISTTGGIADLWGTTLTAAQVRAAGFGVALWSTDTINALQCDFITIAIAWTDVPNAWDERRFFRRRRNTTHRRHLTVRLPFGALAEPPPPEEGSADRALEPGLLIRVLKSRRSLAAQWHAAMSFATPAVPSADRSITEPFVTRQLRGRRLLTALVAPVFPATPGTADQPLSAWAASTARRVVHERRRVVLPPQPSFPVTPETPPPALLPALLATRPHRRRTRQGLFLSGDAVIQAPVAAQFPWWHRPDDPARCRATQRRLLRAAPPPVYPVAAAQPSVDRAIVEPFVTRRVRGRRLLTAPIAPVFPQSGAPPASSDRALESGLLIRVLKSRRHQSSPWTAAMSFATPPAAPVVPPAAWTPQRTIRRPGRPALMLWGGGLVEARVQSQFPSFDRRDPRRIRSAKRRLLRSPVVPVFPVTPAAPAQPLSAWIEPRRFRVAHRRKLRLVAPQTTFPATPPVPPQPYSAWRRPPSTRVAHKRRLRVAGPQPSFPQTPPVPYTSWLTRPVKLVRHRRRFLLGDKQLSFPLTPQPQAAWRLVTAFHVYKTNHRLIPAAPQITYPATPVLTEPVTSWALKLPFRRRGWRMVRSPLEIDERPSTLDTGFLVGEVRFVPAVAATIRIASAVDGEVTVEAGLNGEPRLRPEQ